ncbi:hypothetical protein PoB_003407200, partial [Plakobranchus ocellatus]
SHLISPNASHKLRRLRNPIRMETKQRQNEEKDTGGRDTVIWTMRSCEASPPHQSGYKKFKKGREKRDPDQFRDTKFLTNRTRGPSS